MNGLLNSNQLKLIAMITMTLDHIGFILFPGTLWLRVVGRLAMPLYAFCIGEGCLHSRSLPRYLTSVAVMAALCQGVAFLVTGTLHMNILVTFSMSILLAMVLRWAQQQKKVAPWLVFGGAVTVAYFITEVLPEILSGTDYQVDYGFWGVILPLAVLVGRNRLQQLFLMAVPLLGLAVGNRIQAFALVSLGILLLYNGKRGTKKLKWIFYFYYPLHLAVLNILAMIL